MKVKNEYVKIYTGKKTFTFRNIILNKYLEALAKSQVSGIGSGKAPFLNVCYLKFGEKLIFDEDTELHKKDFDKKCTGSIINQESNSKEVITTYLYNTDDFSSYIDKEITAIGFFEEGIDECYACLDMYGLGFTITDYFNFYIERKDIVSIDADFIKHAIINGPIWGGESYGSDIDTILHIAPGEHTYEGYEITQTQLKNIFLGYETSMDGDVNTISVDESKISEGIIEDTQIYSNNQYTHAWYVYEFITTGGTSTGHLYYIRTPIEKINNFKMSIHFERDNS